MRKKIMLRAWSIAAMQQGRRWRPRGRRLRWLWRQHVQSPFNSFDHLVGAAEQREWHFKVY